MKNELQKDSSESEEEGSLIDSEDKEAGNKRIGPKILHPLEIVEHMKTMWKENHKVLNIIFGKIVCNSRTLSEPGPGYKLLKFSPHSFFIYVLPVPPNRFRPENKTGGSSTYLHQHTVMLQKILSINFELKRTILNSKDKKEVFEIRDTFTKWMELQDHINGYFDSTKGGKTNTADAEPGIKQLLEKKEGIFRMKIMGKRVNYAARSVISPDPMLDTNEVGVPLFVAKKLTFPEAVNEANLDKLKTLIRNGPTQWPGAIALLDGNKKISLEGSTPEQREAIAKSLLGGAENKIVYRHLQHGDVLLFNRQPSLHKPSLMSHIARVLPKEHTIRMHYANCSSYNADFDGDEMNLHLLQNHLARAEAYNLSLSDKQYISATKNNPLRGLIQDIILSAVFLTMKGSFFEKSEYQQLIYTALRTHVDKDSNIKRIRLVAPCIMKPRKLWSGKQLITTIINLVAEKTEGDENVEKLFMTNKGRINEKYLSNIDKEDKQVTIQGNEMVTGILDKASIGESSFGLIHYFYELTDPKRTGKLLSGLSRLFCNYLQMHGFTCGLEDLVMSPEFEDIRKNYIKDIFLTGLNGQAKFLGSKDYLIPEGFDLFGRPAFDKKPSKQLKEVLKRRAEEHYISIDNAIRKKLEEKRHNDKNSAGLVDSVVKSSIASRHSEINEKAASTGLKKKFPENNFSVMTLSGAKGSILNHNQISCMLGQQELEGKRVPIMASGKTLPCFLPYDPNIRAGGYIGDRFLTGLRTQEFFFHCMAGREGLIDTAVKTSRSGYLQRILVKNMESLIVQYDLSVRDNDGSIVQFMYGEDCIDPIKVNAIQKIPFIADNFESFHKHTPIAEIRSKLDDKLSKDWRKSAQADPEAYKSRTIMSDLSPCLNFGTISVKAEKALEDFIASDPRFQGKEDEESNAISKKKFRQLFYAKYFESIAVPGESVGVVAGQSIGEPSTQMTLNTFHLAGHGGVNMTLGVPRLKELLTTKNTSMPTMELHFVDKKITQLRAKRIARQMQRVSLLELLASINVEEQKSILSSKGNKPLPAEKRFRVYTIEFTFEDFKAIKFAFGITKNTVEKVVEKIFKPRLSKTLQKVLDKKKRQGDKKGIQGGEAIIAYDLENLKMRRGAEAQEGEKHEGYPDQSEFENETEVDEGELIEEERLGEIKAETDALEEDAGLISDLRLEGNKCTFKISLPLNTDKLLMLK